MGMTLTETLAGFADQLSFDELPEEVLKSAKIHLLDTIGCMISGASSGEGSRIIAAVTELDKTYESTIVGSKMRTSQSMAALANGTTAHSHTIQSVPVNQA